MKLQRNFLNLNIDCFIIKKLKKTKKYFSAHNFIIIFKNIISLFHNRIYYNNILYNIFI